MDDLFGDQLRDPDRRFELEIASGAADAPARPAAALTGINAGPPSRRAAVDNEVTHCAGGVAP